MDSEDKGKNGRERNKRSGWMRMNERGREEGKGRERKKRK